MTKESVRDESGNEKLINDVDYHTVFIRPKAVIDSSGTVWTSEMVEMRHTNPAVFQVDRKAIDCPAYTDAFCSCCSMIHDYSLQYHDMTTDKDQDKLVVGESKAVL